MFSNVWELGSVKQCRYSSVEKVLMMFPVSSCGGLESNACNSGEGKGPLFYFSEVFILPCKQRLFYPVLKEVIPYRFQFRIKLIIPIWGKQ